MHTSFIPIPSFRLDDKIALVTGASKGLGQAIAIAFAQAGADVIGIASSTMDETKSLIESCGQNFLPLTVDLSQAHANSLKAIVKQAQQWQGHIDILVNNAGIIRRADALDTTEDDWSAVLHMNLDVCFFLAQAVAHHMMSQPNGGAIINIASMLSFQGGIRVPAYTAAKSALGGLTRALCNEWASSNIRVNAIAPGYMRTDNTAALQADEQRNTDILKRIPAGRWGEPSDLAGAAIFLASNAASYVNGHILAVDGGWLAR